jgi:hypothetical protein
VRCAARSRHVSGQAESRCRVRDRRCTRQPTRRRHGIRSPTRSRRRAGRRTRRGRCPRYPAWRRHRARGRPRGGRCSRCRCWAWGQRRRRWCGRWVRRLRRRRCHRGRQQRERVHVRVPAARLAHAEMEVRGCRRALAGRSDRAQALASGYMRASTHRDRRKVQIGSVVAVAGPHAHRQPRRAGRASEPHLPARGGDHRRSDRRRYVDAAVLSARVRVGPVPVLGDHLAPDRPEPGRVSGSGESRGKREEGGQDEKESAHRASVGAHARGDGGGVAELLLFVTRK